MNREGDAPRSVRRPCTQPESRLSPAIRNRSRGLWKRRVGALAAAFRQVTAPWPSTDGRRRATYPRALSILAVSGARAARRPSPMKWPRRPRSGAVLQYVQAAGHFRHVAPTQRRQRNADPQETQPRFQQNGAGGGEGARGQQRRDHARQRMGQDDALSADADGARRQRELGKRLRAPDGSYPSSQTGQSGQSRSGCWAPGR